MQLSYCLKWNPLKRRYTMCSVAAQNMWAIIIMIASTSLLKQVLETEGCHWNFYSSRNQIARMVCAFHWKIFGWFVVPNGRFSTGSCTPSILAKILLWQKHDIEAGSVVTELRDHRVLKYIFTKTHSTTTFAGTTTDAPGSCGRLLECTFPDSVARSLFKRFFLRISYFLFSYSIGYCFRAPMWTLPQHPVLISTSSETFVTDTETDGLWSIFC